MRGILASFFCVWSFLSSSIASAAPLYPQSQKESDILPAGTQAKLCQIALANVAQPRMATGDLGIIRVDVSYLLHDKSISPTDLERLKSPYNLLQPNFSAPGMKVISQRSRIYGENSEKMEYIYLVQAERPGTTEFSTSRNHTVEVGQHEMGSSELAFLKLIIGFRDKLIEEGSSMPSFSDYMEAHVGTQSPYTKKILKEMGGKEEEKPWEERIALANERIASWRRSLARPIYGNFKISGNQLPIEVTGSGRAGVTENQIHHLKADKIPANLQVKVGDLIVLETERPAELVRYPDFPDGYAHKYSVPEVRGNGLVPLHGETIERALLPNDHGTNRHKTYFLVDSAGPASIEIGKPAIDHPYTPPQNPEWVKKIKIDVAPVEIKPGVGVARSEEQKPVTPILPSRRDIQDLEKTGLSPNSVLSKSDAKAILDFFNDAYRGRTPSPQKYEALTQVLRPFFGETKSERLFFLKQCGLFDEDYQKVVRRVDFDLPNDQFFLKLINELLPNSGLATVTNHLKKLTLD